MESVLQMNSIFPMKSAGQNNKEKSMKIVVIGGTGHIGSYLVPKLVEEGHTVINVSRSLRKSYLQSIQWNYVEQIICDREVEDTNGTFAKRIAALQADIVIDNICFTQESVHSIIQALQGNVGHFLLTGTIWVHGYAEFIPTKESDRRRPFGEYGVNKNEIEKILMEAVRLQDFPATIIHPGHIVGPGWACLNPQGNFNLEVFQTIIDGDELLLPNLGLESVHHVHADDVAQLFQKAIKNPHQSIGESFHVVSSRAITLRAYAENVYTWFGHEPKLRFVSLEEMGQYLSEEDRLQTIEHIIRSPCMSVEKASNYLDYKPKYTSMEACLESVTWMVKNGRLRAHTGLLKGDV